MSMNNRNQRLTFPDRLYRLVLALYPGRFRREYGAEMQHTFREMLNDEQIGGGRVWLRVLADVPGSVLAEHRASFQAGEGGIKPSAYGLLLGSLLCVAIVVTNVVYPQFNYFGMNENIAMLLSVAALLAFFAATGFLVSRRTGRILVGTRVGALTALISMGIAMLTFVAVDNLFLEIVSKQPDKLWGLQHSHFTSMRAYINVSHLRGLALVLPLFVLIGAGCSTIGAVVSKAMRKGISNV